jgi:hypothetical protein
MGHETDGEQELSVRLPIYTASANTETMSRYRIRNIVGKMLSCFLNDALSNTPKAS